MDFKALIQKKRDGFALTKEEIEFFAFSAANETVPDYQLSAMLMAIFFNSLNEEETLWLTDAMARSGDMADLSAIDGIKGDKHSTGGVGDKTTLIVAPIVASCGVKMAKMSGRGLGHTGGTVDKLESIPGFRTSLSTDEFTDIVNESGLCVAGQSGRLCPADKKLYGLRDVTATVDNMPLIASSIMSKKLAGGADCIVLDVKCGSGAFMKDKASAKALASKMVEIGRGAGKKIAALITDMDTPLGKNVGNSLEVIEAVETLKGRGPEDLTEICILLCAKLLELAGKGSFDECKLLAKAKIDDGSALLKLAEMVKLQGGDENYILNTDLFPKAEFSRDVVADESGYISSMNTEGVGSVCVALGAGRQRKEDDIDPSAGIVIEKKTGDKIEKGDVIATLYCSDEALFDVAEKQYRESVFIAPTKPEAIPLLLDVVE
ncbi:MAG: thymidine phosphorylase [Clostridia bacterium]|nr:thymidine phosphorylase [Clostridia bacterium]